MQKRDMILSWMIGISLVIIGVLVYLNMDRFYLVLIGCSVALASAVVCWNLALKIGGSGVIAYIIGFVSGLFGLAGYSIYYFIKVRQLKKEEELEKREEVLNNGSGEVEEKV